MPDPLIKLPRRDFLKLATDLLFGLAGLLGLGGLARYFSYQPDPGAQTAFDLGDPSAYPPGSRTLRTLGAGEAIRGEGSGVPRSGL